MSVMLPNVPERSIAWIRARATLALTGCLLMVWLSSPRASEPLYPVALMNWMVEGSFHALIVDKSQQRLSVWRVKDGEPTLVESYRCATGENSGDKWVKGDMRTPEGVYFFCSVIDGRTLPPKYGSWAFTTDYPNFVDRRRGKNGDGIWLHGRDKPVGSRPDSNGCVALENQDLMKVSRFIKLQSTPLIVVDKMIMAPRSAVMEQERAIRDFIDAWRQSWESRNLEGYMAHYSPNIQSSWLDFRGWKEKKRRLYKRYSSIRVKLGNVYLYRQDGLVTAIFTQTYGSESFRSSGVKVLYLTHHGSKYAIYAEDYHQPIDDPFPVGALLARAGADPGPLGNEKNDFRIRLVSTDEPEQAANGDTETPLPCAPSRAVVLDRLAKAAKESMDLPVDSNDKLVDDSSPRRLVVARVSTAQEGTLDGEETCRAREDIGSRPIIALQQRRKGIEEIPKAPTAFVTAAVKSNLQSSEKDDESTAQADPSKNMHAKASSSESDSADKRSVLDFLNKWKSFWEEKDLDMFMKMYHPNFRQGTMNYEMLLKSKRNFFGKYKTIKVELDRVEIRKEKDRTLVRFVQSFHGDDYRDKGRKSMVLDSDKDKGFRIISEKWSPLSGSSSHSGSQSAH